MKAELKEIDGCFELHLDCTSLPVYPVKVVLDGEHELELHAWYDVVGDGAGSDRGLVTVQAPGVRRSRARPYRVAA